MHRSPPLVSVIIPCRNEVDHIGSCLESVLQQDKPDGGFEIIIADGLSDDGTRETLTRYSKTYPDLIVIDNPKQIVPTGLNRAIGVARGEIIVRMDVHTEYAKDYIVQCVKVQHEKGAENVGGAARTKSRTYIQAGIAIAYNSSYSVGGAKFHDKDYEGYVDTVTYGCWPRDTFSRFGEFDEELIRNQDDEHNLRIHRGGGMIWQSARIKSWYYPRATLKKLFNQYQQYGYWKVRVIQKHRIPASIRHLVPGLFVASVILSALFAIGFYISGRITGSNFMVLSSTMSGLTLGIILSTYIVFILFASVVTAKRSSWKYLPILPFTFFCFHFGYGVGFIEGIINFTIFKRSGSVSKTRITR